MWTKSNFKCDRYCGKCCVTPYVMVDKQDIKIIKKLGHEEEDFVQRDYVYPEKFVLKKNDKGCVFLKKNKKGRYSCSIHKNKPKTCRKYPFFDNKAIKSCYPEDLYPDELFSFKAGKFVSNQ
jgi:Fe-S-cluster containining protein